MKYYSLNINKKSFAINISPLEEILIDLENNIKNHTLFPQRILTLNPEIILYALQHDDFYQKIKNVNYFIPDGIGLVYLLKALNISSQRIAGIDFAWELLNIANQHTLSLALIGAQESILQKTIQKINHEFPQINIIYSQHGFFEDEKNILDNIKKKQPDLIFCAMNFSSQEILLSKIQNLQTNSIIIGLGGSFDVWAGNITRAPQIFQIIHLEWLWRVLLQPKRIKRIFSLFFKFIPLVILLYWRHITKNKSNKKH